MKTARNGLTRPANVAGVPVGKRDLQIVGRGGNPRPFVPLTAIFVSLVFLDVAQAADWYVDCSYSGTETGSVTQPYNTIMEAINDVSATGGDTFHIKGGVGCNYDTEQVRILSKLTGSAGSETKFRKWAGSTANPIVSYGLATAVSIEAGYVIWDSIHVTTAGANPYMISFTSAASNVTVQNSTLYNGGGGIFIDNSGGATNDTIQNNTIYAWNSSYGIQIRNAGGGTGGITIRNNLLRDGTNGDAIGVESPNNVMVNNTIDGNTGSGIRLFSGGSAGNDIYNNIFSNNGAYGVRDDDAGGDPNEDYNYYYTNGSGNYTGFTLGTNSIEGGDPLYVDRANKNFHLQSTFGYYPFGASDKSGSDSPAIDAGQASGGYSGYTKEPEDNGDRVNMGAYGNTNQASLSGVCGYHYSGSIKMDGDQVGGSSGYLTNFPVLVNLSGSWLKTAPDGKLEHPSGWDMIFRGLDATTCDGPASCDLDFEIETYDGSTGKLVAWVRVPKLYAGDNDPGNDTVIYMDYGSSCITSDPQNATAVWDSNYKGVWHLAEKYGLDFNGTTSYVDTGYNTHHTQTTIEGWIYPRTWGEGPNLARVVDKREGGSQVLLLYVYGVASPRYNLRFERQFSGGNGGWNTPENSIVLNTWQHIALTYDESDPANDPSLYINGQLQTLNRYSIPSGTATPNADDYIIGNRGAGDRTFDGVIDSLRIYNRILTPVEINDRYQNRREPSRDGSVIEYLMDEGSGTIVSDSSGNGHDGDMTGHEATWVRSRAHDSTNNSNFAKRITSMAAPTQRINGCDPFNVGDGVGILDPGGSWEFADGGLDAGTSDFTISAWFLWSSAMTEQNPTIVYKGGGGSTVGYWFHFDKINDQIWIRVADSVTTRFSAESNKPLNMAADQWYYVTAVFDREPGLDTAYFYLNGQPVGSESSTLIAGNSVSSTLDVWIGTNSFIGNLDEVRVSSGLRTAEWIQTEFNNQKESSPFFATAVDLTSFTATGYDGEVWVEWETGSEIDNLGFNVYRSTSEEGPYTRVTSHAIPGLGSSPQGAVYTYRDEGLTNGVTYYYELEDIETSGKTTRHGPVTATPQAGAVEPEISSSPESRITFGQPELSRIQVLEPRSGEVVLVLETQGFYATPREDGTVEIEIPGYDLTEEKGFPSLPVKRAWVEAIAGRKVHLVSVESLEEEWVEGLQPADAGAAFVEASRQGTVRAAQRRRPRPVGRRPSLYPSTGAQLLSVGFQGDVKKALVEMAPLRWDGASQRLLLTRRLVARLAFRGREVGEKVQAGDSVRGRRYRKRASHETRQVVARLVTREPGLYGVSFKEVFGSHHQRAVRASSLRLSRQGRTVPFHLSPDSGWYRPGAILYFLSAGEEANPYGHEAVYELETGIEGEVMALLGAPPNGAPTPYYWQTVTQEENRIYQPTLVGAPDRWLWSGLFAPALQSYPFETSALSPSPESFRLSVYLQGASDFPADPDHHVRVHVNGNLVGEAIWDGKEPQRIDAEIGAGLLHEGTNQLQVENVGDTEASYSMVMLNRFEVSYPRMLRAQDGELVGRWTASGTAEVVGLGPGAAVLELGPSGPLWLTGAETTASGLRFQAEAERSYRVVSPSALRNLAELRRPLRSSLKKESNYADYLVIGPREFVEVARSLLELRRSQGLQVKAAKLEEIFSEFGFGEENPNAVKDFLSYAYHNWKAPPRYVLLLGDATYDLKGDLGTGTVNQVPPLMVVTQYLETVSDPAYAAVNGDDLLPDLAIGRLPAATEGELQSMVAKILAWETSGRSLTSQAVLVADNPDQAGDFVADAEILARTVLGATELRKIYLSRLGGTVTRSEIQRAFNDGTSLMSYIGHGGIHLWADENIFNNGDVPSLLPQEEQPIVLTMNCLNGYFHFPYFNALAEELMKADGKGAIAAFSPSGLSLNNAAHRYHQALLEELLNGNHMRLGDAVLAAQSAYADSGALPEMLAIYHLFGDPALRLKTIWEK